MGIRRLPEFLGFLAFTLPTVFAKYTPYVQNSFSFTYDPLAPPYPVTEQCQTINVTWFRRDDALGPYALGPYFLQVYTSKFIVPFRIPAGGGPSFEWQVPFAPGTLYQICMLDSVGNSGGCQGIYAMIPPLGNTTTPPTCANVTFPTGAMDVVAEVNDGHLSQYGWVDQCSDIAVTPRNGTPPYTITIAPALLALFIIKSNTMATVNWTVSLGLGVPFFISVIDSAGNSWTNGPLHAGKGDDVTPECLGVSSSIKSFPKAGTIGTAIGGLVIGALVTFLLMLFQARERRKRQSKYSQAIDDLPQDPFSPGVQAMSPPNLTIDAGNPLPGQYQIEPFVNPGENDHKSSHVLGDPTSSSNMTDIRSSQDRDGLESQAGSSSMAQASTALPSAAQRPQLFVIHRDGGRAPVSVYTPSGTVVEELPPLYSNNAERTGSEPTSNGIHDQPRSPS